MRCLSNGGRIFYVFAAQFLRNNIVKFEKIALILKSLGSKCEVNTRKVAKLALTLDYLKPN